MHVWRLAVGIGAALLGAGSGAQTPTVSIDHPQELSGSRDTVWMQAVIHRLASTLVDPGSAQIVVQTGFSASPMTWKIWGQDVTGYFACGRVNAKNRMGGYTGFSTFIGIIGLDGSVETTIDDDQNTLLARVCSEKRQQGLLPPVSPDLSRAIVN